LKPISFSVGTLFVKFIIPDDVSFEDKFLGTGVVIAPNVLLTNRHVVDGYEWLFEENGNGEVFVEFTQERCQQYPEQRFTIKRILWQHERYDAIALEIDPVNPYGHPIPNPVMISNRQYTNLDQGQFCSVIGFPAGYLQSQLEERSVFGEYALPKKRVQPGMIKTLSDREKNIVHKKLRYLKTDLDPDQYPVLLHDCSTLPGNSGSGIFSLDDGSLIALHFAGERLKENYAIPLSELLKDQRFKELISQ
jgi:endonuclease G